MLPRRLLPLQYQAFIFPAAPSDKLTDKDTVVLADFANTTGDPVFDGTLRQGMAVELEQSPFLSIISEGRVQQTLRLMGRPADVRLTPEVAREVCERTSSAAVLDGSIASLGTQYVLGLRANNCRTGDVLAEEQAQAVKKEDVLNVLSHITSKFRARLGESLTTVEQHNTPLETATTSSLEALKAYSAAMQPPSSSGFADALPLLKRAVEIDPQFAMAYAVRGLFYSILGETTESVQNTRKAYELRHHASDRERFFITASTIDRSRGIWKGSNRLYGCGCKLILATATPTDCFRDLQRMAPASTKRQLKRPRSLWESIRISFTDISISRLRIFTPTVWRKPKEPFRVASNTNTKLLTLCCFNTMSLTSRATPPE